MVAAVAERSSGRVRVRVIFMVMVTVLRFVWVCGCCIVWFVVVAALGHSSMAGNAPMVPLVHLNWSCFLIICRKF